MEVTTKGRYAVMAMADIATQPTTVAVPLSQIAERQRLPLAYLEQLFVALRRAELVESARGRTGGYRLARPADQISVSAILTAVEEHTRFARCTGDERCASGQPCLTHQLWSALEVSTSQFLASVSLADVASREKLVPVAAAVARPPREDGVYLDYNATAPLLASAKAAMVGALDQVGNPSSVHASGRKVRSIVESARESVARFVNAKPSEIVFTSGASEANTWVMSQRWDAIFASEIEHDSILAPARVNGASVISVTANGGVVGPDALVEAVSRSQAHGRAVLALQFANNETGIVQNVGEVAEAAREHGLYVHCDAVQAAGRLPIDFAGLALDTMSLSAHKMGGPKGIGALVIRDHLDLDALIRGGGQERRRRAGTENVAAIAGFGAAAEEGLALIARTEEVSRLRDRLEAAVRAVTPSVVVIGQSLHRLGNTTALALPGKLAETLVIRLDMAGISVSAGSACSSGKVGTSHVLEAMGLSREIAQGAIRISLGPETCEDDIDRFIAAWKDIAGRSAIAA